MHIRSGHLQTFIKLPLYEVPLGPMPLANSQISANAKDDHSWLKFVCCKGLALLARSIVCKNRHVSQSVSLAQVLCKYVSPYVNNLNS